MAFWNFIAAYIGPLWLIVAIAAGLLLCWNFRLQRQIMHLEQMYGQLITDTDGGNLGEVLAVHMDNVHKTLDRSDEAQSALKAMRSQLPFHLQHLGMLRFNPFQGTGSDQSFSLAIADGLGNGAVITSLHNRDGTRVYAKPLVAWKSTYTLTDEEREAIRRSQEVVGSPQPVPS